MDHKELISRLIGVYLVADGIFSIIVYRKEPVREHLPRIARALMGAYIAITADDPY